MALSSVFSAPDDGLSNSEVQRLLSHRVAREILGAKDGADVLEIGPLSVNYFSFTFSVKANTPGGPHTVFVKIPKVDLRGREPRILPITAEDELLARDEESSLRSLSKEWRSDDLDVRWVNLRGFVPEYNAIVTDRVVAVDALSVFRGCDMRRRLGARQDAERLRSSMARLGGALGRFHRAHSAPGVFSMSRAFPRLEFYCRELAASSGSVWPQRVLERLRSIHDLELPCIEVPTLKGLDIRNVLTDAKGGLYLLDPGKTKIACREADLARFIMTYRILYWGQLLMLLLRVPDNKAEEAFLAAHETNSGPSCPKLLNLYLLKEQLKHWHTALDSLGRLGWPPATKRLAQRVYVNPFYERQVASQLSGVTE